MDRLHNAPAGSCRTALIDQDIAHITRVMRPSLQGDLGGPILPSAYWRKRLYELLDGGQLSQAQLYLVDSLLLQLDQFDASAANTAQTAQAAHEAFAQTASPSATAAGRI